MMVFIDIEASSLTEDSFPIEIAWVDESGRAETHLFHPAPEWLHAMHHGHAWSRESEQVHGIPLNVLLTQGTAANTVAHRALTVLGPPGTVPCSDQPRFDRAWLADLLRAAHIGPVPPILDLHEALIACFRPLVAALPPAFDPRHAGLVSDLRAATARIIAQAWEAEARTRRDRHRALPDAQAHRRLWLAVRDSARALTGHSLDSGRYAQAEPIPDQPP